MIIYLFQKLNNLKKSSVHYILYNNMIYMSMIQIYYSDRNQIQNVF